MILYSPKIVILYENRFMKKQAYIIDGIRTAIGNFGGTLSPVRADDLAAHAIKGLMDRNPGLDFSKIEDVIMGCANQAGEDNRNVARMAGLLAGLPSSVPGETVNRLCASGMSSVIHRGEVASIRMTLSRPPEKICYSCLSLSIVRQC